MEIITPRLIFLGDTHGFLDDFSKQKELIERFKPKMVLHEQLQEYILDSENKFKEILSKKFISEMVKFNYMKNLIELCYTNGIELSGIDLVNFGFNKHLQEVVKGELIPNERDEEDIGKIVLKRERRHIEKITKALEKTSGKILVIVGCWHLRKGSPLRKQFEEYILIHPEGSKGEVLVCLPEKNEVIKYREVIKWK